MAEISGRVLVDVAAEAPGPARDAARLAVVAAAHQLRDLRRACGGARDRPLGAAGRVDRVVIQRVAREDLRVYRLGQQVGGVDAVEPERLAQAAGLDSVGEVPHRLGDDTSSVRSKPALRRT